MRSSRRFVVLMFAALFSAPRVATAMDTGGDLMGRVTDASGHAIPGAEVRLVNAKTGDTLVTRAESDGRYRFRNVDTSVAYTIFVRQAGFVPQVRTPMHASSRGVTIWMFRLRAVTEGVPQSPH